MDRDCLAELHGNMFVDECAVCKRMFVRSGASSTVGRKMSNESCKAQNVKRPCRGKLRDFVLGTIHILRKHLYSKKPNFYKNWGFSSKQELFFNITFLQNFHDVI